LKRHDIPIYTTVSLTFLFLLFTFLRQNENDVGNLLIITILFAGVSIFILAIRGAPQPVRPPAKPPPANPRVIKNVIWLFLGSGIALVVAIILTLTYQYIPSNQIPEEFSPQGSPFIVTITRDATILVPLRNLLTPIISSIEANIYYKTPGINIQNVKLFSSDSVLTFKPDFIWVRDYQNGSIYKNNVMVRHNLAVSNTSNLYQIRISYLNSTGGLNQLPLQFVWPIKMLDLDIVSYFWIVLIGVITSRVLTLFKNQKKALVQLEIKDYIWIIFSFIIGLLIFSNFKDQINPTSDIIINISLAFGFGFGFEKVLEVGEEFSK
jgi:hypothetical protein